MQKDSSQLSSPAVVDVICDLSSCEVLYSVLVFEICRFWSLFAFCSVSITFITTSSSLPFGAEVFRMQRVSCP